MKHKTYLRVGWVVLPILLTLLVSVLTILPAQAATRRAYTQKATTPLGATIYLTNGTLAPIFQSRVDQQVPGVVSAAIASIVSRLPAAEVGLRRWQQQSFNHRFCS